MAQRRNTQIKLSKALVLNRWILSQFGANDLTALADAEFKRSVYEGLDQDNKSHYHHYLLNRVHTFPRVTKSQLIAWDQNIVSHTLAISEHRESTIKWKYFQYLALLFTELYLERFFKDKEGLLKELNAYVESWNDPLDHQVLNSGNFICDAFKLQELNKLAFWNATGSGKTLLMHVNILQYKHYVKTFGGKDDFNKVLLVTPNEGLSTQHLKEFADSGLQAEIFSKKSGSAFSGQMVEIIEISKLAEESGEKTVSIESFETNNLVLIDEGHRGVAGDQWKQRRDYLSQTGFAFEYSATFGQAVSAASGPKKTSLMQEYSKTILMDYSYKYFYEDGYGKDYNILNIPEHRQDEFLRKYLTGALLSFYQQLRIFNDQPTWNSIFRIHMPLWVFVGGSVNAVRKEQGRDTSDVLDIIDFFAAFIQDPAISKKHLEELLEGKDGIVDQRNTNVFAAKFGYLNNHPLTTEELYADILAKVFHAETAGAQVYIDQLKGQDGELGIRVGSNYFGVINVGDDAKLFKLCQDRGIPGESKDFTASLFQTINDKSSKVTLLIGAKKFTEGWSSWRVSTMGLMNIGRSEGSQIIQLFGRGVRLKGYDFSLKRSSGLDDAQRPEMKIPRELKHMETLQIFGIRADYMQQFKEFLEEEGLPANDSAFTTVELPIMLTTQLGNIKLKVLQVKEGYDFKKDKIVDLGYDSEIGTKVVRLEWYPKVQALSGYQNRLALPEVDNSRKLQDVNLAFIDWDEVFFSLQQFKNERSWYNLSIRKEELQDILLHESWYDLVIPEGSLTPNTFRQVKEWQEIVTALLKGYAERYYNMVKSGYLSERMEPVELTAKHPNFYEQYRFEVEKSREDIITKLIDIKTILEKNNFNSDRTITGDVDLIHFMNHLYSPLVYFDAKRYKDILRLSPVPLNYGEKQFVNHLKHFYLENPDFFKERQLYLLRNQSRKGIGFFEANGFYPDFIVWLIEKEHQYISFVDPKGLRQISGFEHPKMRFYKSIKETIQRHVREEDPNLTLNAFIVTPTLHEEVRHWQHGDTIHAFNNRNVYFMNEQQKEYIGGVLSNVFENAQ
jgi:hypothetical protein